MAQAAAQGNPAAMHFLLPLQQAAAAAALGRQVAGGMAGWPLAGSVPLGGVPTGALQANPALAATMAQLAAQQQASLAAAMQGQPTLMPAPAPVAAPAAAGHLVQSPQPARLIMAAPASAQPAPQEQPSQAEPEAQAQEQAAQAMPEAQAQGQPEASEQPAVQGQAAAEPPAGSPFPTDSELLASLTGIPGPEEGEAEVGIATGGGGAAAAAGGAHPAPLHTT